MAPLRVAHDLTNRQRRILQAIAGAKECQFASIRAQIEPTVADRTLRADLLHFKKAWFDQLSQTWSRGCVVLSRSAEA